MPATWQVIVYIDGEPPMPWDVSGVISTWLEGHLTNSDHHAPNYKPWSINALEVMDDGLLRVAVGVAGAEQAELLRAGAEQLAGRPARIRGRRWQVVSTSGGEPAALLDVVRWRDLLDVPEVPARIVLAFHTPTVFGDGPTALVPSETNVFGSLRTRWRRHAPADAPVDVDIVRTGAHVEYEHTRRVVSTVRKGGREHNVNGLIGVVSYLLGPDGEEALRMCRDLEALARMARFFGVGQYTTQAWGATQLLATVPARDGRVPVNYSHPM